MTPGVWWLTIGVALALFWTALGVGVMAVFR